MNYFDTFISDTEFFEELGLNIIRTYDPILDVAVLDELHRRNFFLMQPIFLFAGAGIVPETSDLTNIITSTRDHPAVLKWYVGNEWNYNNLYAGNALTFDGVLELVNRAARMAGQLDSSRPIASIYGELPPSDVIQGMPSIDVWGTNIHRSDSFDDVFQTLESRTEKPLFVGEYGADAYNALIDAPDSESQALATKSLTELIVVESTVNGGVLSGGIIFEFCDKWWKSPGSDLEQDIGGIAPGGGPFPDLTFPEEWCGLTDINRNKREAFTAFKDIPVPGVIIGDQPEENASPSDSGCSTCANERTIGIALLTFVLGVLVQFGISLCWRRYRVVKVQPKSKKVMNDPRYIA